MINGIAVLDPCGCASHPLASFLLKGHVFNYQLHKWSLLCDVLAFLWAPPVFDHFNKKILSMMSFVAPMHSPRTKYSGKDKRATLTKLERKALETHRQTDIKKRQSNDDCQGERVSGSCKAKQKKRRKKERNQLPSSSSWYNKAMGSNCLCLSSLMATIYLPQKYLSEPGVRGTTLRICSPEANHHVPNLDLLCKPPVQGPQNVLPENSVLLIPPPLGREGQHSSFSTIYFLTNSVKLHLEQWAPERLFPDPKL